MNKIVIRTSLVWAGIMLIAVVALLYHSGNRQRARTANAPASEDQAPLAAGPAASAAQMPSKESRSTEAQLAPVQLSPERLQSIGVRTGKVEYKELSDDIRATGTVEIDERRVSYVQIRFAGYIRKVFANATYQYVRKGQPLFTIYSPELAATQQEYLLARQNQKLLSASTVDGVGSGAASLASAAEQRLLQWQVAQPEIAQMRATGKAITDLTISSPSSGYITEYNALPNMYVEPSTRLYMLADLSEVWVNAQVFQDDLGRVKPGDRVQLNVGAYPGTTFSGRIEQILPQIDMTTRTAHVRLAVTNPALKLKPGMFVNVNLIASLGRQLVIPASAVLQSGTRQTVFLDHGNGSLEPQDVTLGARVGDDFVVLRGLTAHQQIVTSANFLIDSESQLQSAAGSFAPPPPGAGNAVQQNGSSAGASQANIDFTTDPNPPNKGANTFRVKLTGPDKNPVAGADVTVSFYMAAMPAMSMAAMNTTSKLTDKGNGLYEGSGSLGSGGTWQVTITALKNGQTIATKQLRVNTTGGM